MFGMMIDTGPKFYTVPSPHRHGLRTFMLSFTLKFLEPHCSQTVWYICFMFDMMIHAGPKFYVRRSPTQYMTLKIKVMDLEFLY